ncbi:MAG: hypothetical protein E6H83_02470 [Chloroflexi bacterium]|nr:MAG: hypothetical protein E6H83_02470 [Chloroflexota bacterium]
MNLGLGACEAVDGIEGLRLDRIRRVRLLDDFAQRRHGSLDAVAHADQNAGACRVASGLATDLDRDLVAQAKRFHDGVEQRPVRTAVDKRTERHVA